MNPDNQRLTERLANIKLLSLDVDGVLTDGTILYSESGEELRGFNAKDGIGIKLLMRAGVTVAWLSGGMTTAITHRGRRLGVPHVHIQVKDKLALLQEICDGMGITLDQAAHMGDDTNDLPLMRACGFGFAPHDAMPVVIRAADYVTRLPGGRGCVREACDLLVVAHGGNPELHDGTNV